MNTIFVAILLGGLAVAANAQEKVPAKPVNYDAKMASKLGGNDYGMKSYILVILKTGPKDADFQAKARNDIFTGHMANITRLADEDKLAVAGPFTPNDKGYRGLYIFNVKTVEEAAVLVESDPAVSSGILIPDMTPWFGSASLMATNELHKKITKPAKPAKPSAKR